jgi:hypothetical protein
MGGSMTDKLLAALRAAWPKGLDATARLRVFENNKRAAEIDAVLQALVERGQARIESTQTSGGGPEKITAFAVRTYEERRITLRESLVVRVNSYVRKEKNTDSATSSMTEGEKTAVISGDDAPVANVRKTTNSDVDSARGEEHVEDLGEPLPPCAEFVTVERTKRAADAVCIACGCPLSFHPGLPLRRVACDDVDGVALRSPPGGAR